MFVVASTPQRLERNLGLAPAFSLECERAPHDTNSALNLSKKLVAPVRFELTLQAF